jgi:hypothetical protein
MIPYGSRRIGEAPYPLRLNPRFRWLLYAAFSALVLTGVGWLMADRHKEAADAELWQQTAANLLMVHGGAAMLTLLLLGALLPLHLQRAWRGGKNRATGAVMVTLNAILIVTAFGLYYSGSDVVRPWISDLHIGVGLLLPAVFVVHVVLGRQSTSRAQSALMRLQDR